MILLGLILVYIGLAIGLYYFFAKGDRGAKEPRSALIAACLFGFVATIAAGELNAAFVSKEVIELIGSEGTVIPPFVELIKAGLTIGLIEETVKFLPLAIFMYGKKYFNENTDGVKYFAMAGMTFGVIESILYTLTLGSGVGIMRVIIAPFLHAGFTALAGMGLIRFKLKRHNIFYLIAGLGSAIILHGAYDFFLFSAQSWYILCALAIAVLVNIIPFRYFINARKADEKLGLSAVGENRFCRNCGQPNFDRHLYCVHCGQKS